jgi:hypothetical protein
MREFDVVLFGATGFTGRFVAEALAGAETSVRWAIAGRDRERLAAVRAELVRAHGAAAEVPIVVARSDDAASLRARLQAAGQGGAAFGLSVPGSGQWALLQLREDFDPVAAGLGALAPALQRLDVVLLHELLLERALGISKAAQAAKTNLRYDKSTDNALQLARTASDDTQLCCFMNATPVADVRAVCDSGEVMPQKSTFFHPKIPNGLVFHDLRAADRDARDGRG